MTFLLSSFSFCILLRNKSLINGTIGASTERKCLQYYNARLKNTASVNDEYCLDIYEKSCKTISNAHFLWYNCKQIKVAKMALSYNGLWKLLIDKGLNKGYLHKLTGLSRSTITKLVKGENVNTDVLERICIALECQLDDIVEMKKEEI